MLSITSMTGTRDKVSTLSKSMYIVIIFILLELIVNVALVEMTSVLSCCSGSFGSITFSFLFFSWYLILFDWAIIDVPPVLLQHYFSHNQSNNILWLPALLEQGFVFLGNSKIWDWLVTNYSKFSIMHLTNQ